MMTSNIRFHLWFILVLVICHWDQINATDGTHGAGHESHETTNSFDPKRFYELLNWFQWNDGSFGFKRACLRKMLEELNQAVGEGKYLDQFETRIRLIKDLLDVAQYREDCSTVFNDIRKLRKNTTMFAGSFLDTCLRLHAEFCEIDDSLVQPAMVSKPMAPVIPVAS